MFQWNVFPSAGRAAAIVAGAAVLAGIIGFSIVMAQGSSSPDTPTATPTANTARTQFIRDLATQLGIPVATLTDAIRAADLSQLQQFVDSGKITQAQADKIKSAIQSAGSPPFGVGGHGHLRHVLKAEALTGIAQFLNTDTTTIKQALKNGQSLAQIAQDHGKTADQLTTFLVNAAEQKLKDAVAAGKMTQAKADSIQSNLQTRISKIINATHGQHANGSDSSGSQSATPTASPGTGSDTTTSFGGAA